MENKRVLILSANTGAGHNSAARAIREALESRGCRCVIQDGLAFMPGMVNRLICGGHILFYRKLPRLYGAGYRLMEKHSRPKAVSGRPCRRLMTFLENGHFDAVICTHVFAAQMISGLRASGKLALPCFFLATDYTCSPGVNRLDMDLWMIPHQTLVPEFIRRGIPRDKIAVTGIPVCREFSMQADRSALRRSLNLPPKRKIVVVSCGSMGTGAMERMAVMLAEGIGDRACIVALCGSNQGLLKRLSENRNLTALGFVKSIAEYMAAADVYITKPGGLNTTEAMVMGVPTMLFNAVPGVESRNLEFIAGLGCAVSPEDICRDVMRILEDDARRNLLSERCRAQFSGNAAETICDLVIEKELSI